MMPWTVGRSTELISRLITRNGSLKASLNGPRAYEYKYKWSPRCSIRSTQFLFSVLS